MEKFMQDIQPTLDRFRDGITDLRREQTEHLVQSESRFTALETERLEIARRLVRLEEQLEALPDRIFARLNGQGNGSKMRQYAPPVGLGIAGGGGIVWALIEIAKALGGS